MVKGRPYSMASSIAIYQMKRRRPIECDRKPNFLYRQAKTVQVIDIIYYLTHIALLIVKAQTLASLTFQLLANPPILKKLQ
jgi:hypothetical protein